MGVSPQRDEKSGWTTDNSLPAPAMRDVERMLAPWLTARVLEVELLPGGFMNRNCRVRLDAAPFQVVLRLYDRNAMACAKEVAVLTRLCGDLPVPRVLHAEPSARDGHPPFAVLERADGISLRDLLLSGHASGVAEAAYDAGLQLARLQVVQFPASGFLTSELTVDVLTPPAVLTIAAFVESCVAWPQFQARVEPSLGDRVVRVAREWEAASSRPFRPTLVHGDFNSRNVLVKQDRDGWRVSAILDWEFAFAGSVLCDVGNFLRYERPARPRFEPFFSRGCREGGLDLDGDWRQAARIADLPALCEFLTQASMPESVVAEVRGLIVGTLDSSRARQ